MNPDILFGSESRIYSLLDLFPSIIRSVVCNEVGSCGTERLLRAKHCLRGKGKGGETNIKYLKTLADLGPTATFFCPPCTGKGQSIEGGLRRGNRPPHSNACGTEREKATLIILSSSSTLIV